MGARGPSQDQGLEEEHCGQLLEKVATDPSAPKQSVQSSDEGKAQPLLTAWYGGNMAVHQRTGGRLGSWGEGRSGRFNKALSLRLSAVSWQRGREAKGHSEQRGKFSFCI